MHYEREALLSLFMQTEVFIFVFVEIVTSMPPVQRVIFKMGGWRDRLIFIILFGGFSIMGTALGIPLKDGVIANIRDFAPMLAGLTAGPLVGICVGLIGGVHRLMMGGFTAAPCALATIITGVFFGCIYHLNKGKLIGIIPAMAFALTNELMHGALNLLIARPWEAAWAATSIAIPAMMIANSLGIAIGIIITSNKLKEHQHLLGDRRA